MYCKALNKLFRAFFVHIVDPTHCIYLYRYCKYLFVKHRQTHYLCITNKK